MKFIIDKDVFLNELKKIETPALVSNTTPVLNSFYIEAEKGKLHVRTMNMLASVYSSFKADIKEEGVVCVYAKGLMDFLVNLEEGDITFAVDGDKVKVNQKKVKLTINTFKHEEYPAFRDTKPEVEFEVPYTEFAQKLSAISIASGASVGFNIDGILLDIDDKLCYNLVASDGKRAAGVIGTKSDKKLPYIIPNMVVRLVTGCGKEGEVIKVGLNKKHVRFLINGITIIGNLLDCKFPDYNKAFSSQANIHLTVSKTALGKALKRASVLVKNEINDSVILNLSEKSVSISKHDDIAGGIIEEVDGITTGGDLKIGFNPKFIQVLLSSVAEEQVCLHFSGSDKPMVYKKDDYIYIALPMRLE